VFGRLLQELRGLLEHVVGVRLGLRLSRGGDVGGRRPLCRPLCRLVSRPFFIFFSSGSRGLVRTGRLVDELVRGRRGGLVGGFVHGLVGGQLILLGDI
jgi:hypothetical protein